MAVMENGTWPSYASHHRLRGDPFASRLSREADIVAAFYICIIEFGGEVGVAKVRDYTNWRRCRGAAYGAWGTSQFFSCILWLIKVSSYVNGILSATGNGYVIYMTIKRKTKLKPPELMTVNLAIFDFGISVTGKPFFVVSSFSHRWLFGWEGCRFYGWAGFFFGCGSLITMTMVSLDRYLKICHLRYGTWLKRHHTFLGLAFVWAYVAFWATMPLIGWGNYAPEPFGTSCTLDWWLAQASVSGQTFVVSILFFCLILPTGIIVFSYVMIIFKVKSSAKEISNFDARIKNSHNLEMKLTKVAMLICAGFLIAWIPYAVVSVVSAFGEPDSIPISVSIIPTLLAKSSAMYNPIIYQVVDLKNSCGKSSCFKALKKRRHFRKSRFCTISGSLKDTAPAKEAHIEMHLPSHTLPVMCYDEH